MTEVTMFFIIMLGLMILCFILNAHGTTEEEKEKKPSELRYDDLTKEKRYLKFKETYEFQERLGKETGNKRKGLMLMTMLYLIPWGLVGICAFLVWENF